MEIIKMNTTLAKTVLSLFASVAMSFAASAQTSSTHGDHAASYKIPTAYHEFVVFGNDKMYMSHYSMFHAIHAYQIIVQVGLHKDGKDIGRLVRAEQAAHPDRHYTVSPAKVDNPESRRRDDWILPEYMKVGVKFNTDVHWGTNADQFLERNVTATIEKIVYFKQFDDIKSHNSKLTYLIFGEPGNYFAAHRVSTFPDFDQIVEIDDPGVKVSLDEFVADVADTVGDRIRKSLDGVLSYSGGKKQIKLTVKKEIYFEELEEQP
jgi:hypothetical protein